MNDFNPQNNVKDKIVIVGQKEQEAQLKLITEIKPKKGHTVFEVDLKKQTIVPAEFEIQTADYLRESTKQKGSKVKVLLYSNGAKKTHIDALTPRKKTLIKKENCLYISALNVKNVYKKLEKMGYVRILKKSKS